VPDSKVIVFQINVNKRIDEFVLDEMPYDPGHLIAIHLDNGIFYLDFIRHAAPL
jgi:hypothetical protein